MVLAFCLVLAAIAMAVELSAAAKAGRRRDLLAGALLAAAGIALYAARAMGIELPSFMVMLLRVFGPASRTVEGWLS